MGLMAGLLPNRRRLYVHAAHPTVGVSGGAVAFRTGSRTESFSSTSERPRPLHVALLHRSSDPDAATASTLLGQHLRLRCHVQCGQVDFDAIDSLQHDFPNADCAVVVGGGLWIARNWLDLAADSLVESGLSESVGQAMKIEPAAAACGHPVLDRVRPFTVDRTIGLFARIPAGATRLLIGRANDTVRTVAWACRGWPDRAFHASLGAAEDFRRPDFLRLA